MSISDIWHMSGAWPPGYSEAPPEKISKNFQKNRCNVRNNRRCNLVLIE